MSGSTPLKTGASVGAYRIDQVYATRRYGVLYRAHDPQHNRQVLIQEFLPRELAARKRNSTAVRARPGSEHVFDETLTLFLQEARTLAQIHDPYVSRVHEYTEANGTAYLVLEYEPGQSLAAYLKNTGVPVSENELRQIFIPLLKGLRVVHDAGLLHRDITPIAIYLRDAGPPMLTWFGATHRAPGIGSSLDYRISPGYSPIELYHEDNQLSPATDLYSLGAVMYRCISGSAPVDPTQRLAAIARRDDDPLVPAIEIGRGDYSTPLLAAIDTLLQPVMLDRPATAGDVLGPLAEPKVTVAPQPSGEALVSAPAKPLQAPVTRRRHRPSRRNLLPLVMGLAAVTVVAGVVLFRPSSSPAPTVAPPDAGQSATDNSKSAPPGATATVVPGTAEPSPQAAGANPAPAVAIDDLPPQVPDTVNFTRRGDDDRVAVYRELERNEKEARELVERADKLIKEQKYDEAFLELRKATTLDPRNADAKQAIGAIGDALLLQAKEQVAAGSLDQADALLARIDRINPTHFGIPALRRQIADIRAQKLREDQARAEAEQERKREIATGLQRGQSAFQSGRYVEPGDDNALMHYRAVLKIDAENKVAQEGIADIVLIYLNRANRALAADQFDQAESALATATAIAPDNDAARLLTEQLKTRRMLALQAKQAPAPAPPVIAPPPVPTAAELRQKRAEDAQKNLERGIQAYYAGSYDKAFTLLSPLADAGVARAQLRMGVMYYLGRGAPKSQVDAEIWINKALPAVRDNAAKGRAWAQADLGSLYEDGLVVEQNDEEAVRWYRLAAEQGYAGAQTNLGVMYANGKGVEPDLDQAIKWLRRAAAQGDRIARENLVTLGAQ